MSLDDTDPAVEPEVTEATDAGSTTETPPATAEEPEPEPAPEAHEIVLEGEDNAAQPAPKDSAAWARMRKEKADAERRAAELERKLQTLQQPAGVADPGPEPTLAGCEYDEERFKAEHAKHLQAKAQKAQHDAQAAKSAEDAGRALRALEDKYKASKVELSKQVPDYAEAEAAVIAAFSPDRQDALLKGTDNAALVVGYIGKHPKLLEEFAKETDRDRFVARLAKLEAKLNVKKTGTNQAPPPEKPVRGTGAAGPGDSTENKLRTKAAETGDYTELRAYQRKIREQQRK